ncbi:cytochrome P450 [Actinoplanes sp. NPDC051494]|uniref:cytochrome P450 n=1 Tax=Actinoplanes sp. NPDC051494 TaxID=3363907 RepID=UPI003794ECBB
MPTNSRPLPVLPGAPIVGAALDLRRDYLGTVLRAAREVGPVTRISAGPPGWRASFVSVTAPGLVLEILGQPQRYTRDTAGYAEMRWAFGNGMPTSQGDVWLRQRRLLAPVFTPRRISGSYAAVMVEESQKLVAGWREHGAAGTGIDAHDAMVTLTSRIIGRVLFGADMAGAIPRMVSARHVGDTLLRRGVVPHPMPVRVPTPANRRLVAGVRTLRSVVDDVITARRSRPSGDDGCGEDMLTLLLDAQRSEDPDRRLSDTEVADQVLIFLLAGHDTTATALACLLVELARSPHWQSVLRTEIGEVLAGRPATAADVSRLPWTYRAVCEALRLYPPAHTIARVAAADEVLGGYRVPAGSTVLVTPWAVHRSPDLWPEPDTFDPGRFDLPPDRHPGGHRNAWLPFGAGPHTCVGMQLAMQEAVLAVATILSAFDLSTTVDTIKLEAALSLHPATALPVRLTPVAG